MKLAELGISICMIASSLGFWGCKNSYVHSIHHGQSIRNIHFDQTIPKDQYKLLAEDLHVFHSIPLDASRSAELQRMLSLREGSTASLWEWLEDRVQYIVSETLLGSTQIASNRTLQQMSNLGATLYHNCDVQGVPCFIQIPGHQRIEIRSPRTGVLQVGSGLFKPVIGTSGHPLDSIVSRLFRLSVLFHEARHSDGNRNSSGVPLQASVIANEERTMRIGTRSFFHVKCPSGHHLENKYSCDYNLNGPYTVEALLLESIIRSCVHCTVKSKEAIRLMIADARSRVLTHETILEWDDTPEGVR